MARQFTVNVDVGEGIKKLIDEMAKESNRTPSAVVRAAVTAYHYHRLYGWDDMAEMVNNNDIRRTEQS